MKFTLHTLEDWYTVVDAVKPLLKYPILTLTGNLGAGKTTFTQFLLKSLGSSDEINSPTYSIVNEYDTPQGKVFHFDLYRLKNIDEVYDIGIEEYLESAYLSIIEWPEIFSDALADYPHHEMSIENKDSARQIFFK